MSKYQNQLLNSWWHHSLCLYRRPFSVTHEFWGILWFIIHIKHQNKQNKSCYRREKGRKFEYLNKFLLNDPLQILISLRGVKFQASSHRKGWGTSYREGGTHARRHHQPKVGEGSVSQKSRRALLGARWASEDGDPLLRHLGMSCLPWWEHLGACPRIDAPHPWASCPGLSWRSSGHIAASPAVCCFELTL